MKLTQEQLKQIEVAIKKGGDITLSFPKPEPEKWEPKSGKWYFIKDSINYGPSFESYSKIGSERNSKEEAKIALAGQIRRNLLSAWAAEHGGEQPFVKGKNNWSVFISSDNKAVVDSNIIYYRFETVYMTEEATRKFCKWYNEGRVDI